LNQTHFSQHSSIELDSRVPGRLYLPIVGDDPDFTEIGKEIESLMRRSGWEKGINITEQNPGTVMHLIGVER